MDSLKTLGILEKLNVAISNSKGPKLTQIYQMEHEVLSRLGLQFFITNLHVCLYLFDVTSMPVLSKPQFGNLFSMVSYIYM